MKNVEFCSKCVESSERFIGSVTFADQKKDKKTVTNFEGNVCSGCKYYEYKKTNCFLIIFSICKWFY